VRFGLSDQSTAQTAALRQATREALARATAMADAIGKRLTRVVDIRAADVAVPRPLGMEPLAMARAATTPVETGELTIQARVILRAEFE